MWHRWSTEKTKFLKTAISFYIYNFGDDMKEYSMNIWQYRPNGHITGNREDYEEHLRYILENPVRWCYDELYTE